MIVIWCSTATWIGLVETAANINSKAEDMFFDRIGEWTDSLDIVLLKAMAARGWREIR